MKPINIDRVKRNHELSTSDWTQLPGAPLSSAKKAEWAAYRQALRDLPAKFEDGAMIDWPQPPSK